MIPKEIYNYDKARLIDWLRNEAGSSNPNYFSCNKPGGFKLQQVPEEYAQLLLFLRQQNIETYLGLGIGNGGSFAIECFFMQESLKRALAVDNLAYGDQIKQNEAEIMKYLEMIPDYKDLAVGFINATTDRYFAAKDFAAKDKEFDVIFIDADHSYAGAKKDYDNSLKRIKKGGFIIFHDINSKACPGIIQLWGEAKRAHPKNWEFIHSTNCGIGIVQI